MKKSCREPSAAWAFTISSLLFHLIPKPPNSINDAVDEPLAISPLWLEFSGLPSWINGKVRSGAWVVFKKIVELDCQQNAIPDIVEAAPVEIAQWTGLSCDIVVKILAKFRQKRLIAMSQGGEPEELALIQIQIPIKTPVSPSEVLRESGKAFLRPGTRLRYAYPIDETPDDEIRLQQVVDLYFNNISMKMNSFILDELRLVARRFTLESVRKTFNRASLNDAPELRWAVRELIKESAPEDEAGTPSPEGAPTP